MKLFRHGGEEDGNWEGRKAGVESREERGRERERKGMAQLGGGVMALLSPPQKEKIVLRKKEKKSRENERERERERE